MDNLRLYFITWNVGTKSPDQNLHPLLSLDANPEKDKMLYDFYIINLQEVKAQPHNMLVDILFEDPWTNAFRDILERRDYVKVKTIRLQGLVQSVYCLRRHLLNLREIETQYTRTGISGFWGNKGAVSVRLGIYGCSLCFVNAHLSAHDDHLNDRVDDYNDIIKDQEFHVDDHTQILHHDYVFWMGDLNFRLSEDFELSPLEIELQIKKGNFKPLLIYDQLLDVMKKGLAFSELRENPPTFPPTFKFEVGSDDYDHKRKPAWTDRILYKVGANNYENVTLKAEQLSYKSHDHYMLSDHRPVSSEFNIKVRTYFADKTDLQQQQQQPPNAVAASTTLFSQQQVFSDYSERVVEFDPITAWTMDEENCADFKMSPGRDTAGDWIGLYKDKFGSLDEYVTYVYVNKGSSPAAASRSPHRAALGVKPKHRRTIQFPEASIRTTGMYRLIYFSQTSNNVQSVLGMSDPFYIQKHESD